MSGKIKESKPLPQVQKFRDLARELECGDARVLRAHLQRMIEDKWLVAGVFNREAALGARARIDASRE